MSHNQDTKLHFQSCSEARKDGYELPLRMLLYSHDSVGLGHLRRNLAIANEIAGTFPNANIMILTGSPCATQFELPANTDMIKIPSITKNDRGRYVTQNGSESVESVLKLRSQMILQAFRSFEPALIIMDHQLTGLKGEAMEMLREARKKGVLMFYGLRDIKDSPEAVRQQWSSADSRWALNEAYDRVCVYGIPEVFDPRVAYAPLLDGVRHIDFTGYIVSSTKKTPTKTLVPSRRKKVLVTFGGGGDGAQRAESYLEALATEPVPWDSHIITGPLMDAHMKKRIRKQAKKLQPIGSVKVQRFHRNVPELLGKVDTVVSMAGYNSCAEILQSGVPAVLLPRFFPREEQLVRATLMAKLGWVSVLPEEKPDPRALLDAIKIALKTPRRVQPEGDLNGLGTLSQIIIEQLQTAGLINNMQQCEQSKSRVM